MGSIAPLNRNPLAAGFYTVPEAARLIEVGDARRIYGWLRGYPGSAMGPLIRRDFQPIDGDEELSFLDLMEMRAIEYFRDHGVKARTMRRALEEARDYLKAEHPFATDHIAFRADEKFVYIDDILKRSAKEEHDRLLYNLITKRFESYTLLKETITRGVEFDPGTHLPRQWTPRAAFPTVKINPRVSYGRPALASGIATITLYDAWRAEGGNYDEVAYWFGVPSNDVQAAVEFEEELAKAA
ncbi:MAG: hypothetical protein WCC90_17680 [Methylocella sp.]